MKQLEFGSWTVRENINGPAASVFNEALARLRWPVVAVRVIPKTKREGPQFLSPACTGTPVVRLNSAYFRASASSPKR